MQPIKPIIQTEIQTDLAAVQNRLISALADAMQNEKKPDVAADIELLKVALVEFADSGNDQIDQALSLYKLVIFYAGKGYYWRALTLLLQLSQQALLPARLQQHTAGQALKERIAVKQAATSVQTVETSGQQQGSPWGIREGIYEKS